MVAGYIMSLDSIESLEKYIFNGIYSTKLSTPSNYWKKHHEATFADYATMQPGDNIYFFIKRKIYGIGEIVQVGDDCKFLNYPNANKPFNFTYNDIKNDLLWDEGEHSKDQRWICVFKPNPNFFMNGIDMDEALSSNPSKFRSLRAFWKVSFIKLDDDENQALKDVILKNNQHLLNNSDKDFIFNSKYQDYHLKILNLLKNNNYKFEMNEILSSCCDAAKLKHEMAIEAGILFQLSNKEKETTEIFGQWDYISHQVIASPFKPVDYMDKMDIFGYSFIPEYNPTKSKFLVMELKKDNANKEDIDQLLKYVDWVNDDYSHGDYSMIHSFLVASGFSEDVINYSKEIGIRKYVLGRRPPKSEEWSNLKLVKYSFDEIDNKIRFDLVK